MNKRDYFAAQAMQALIAKMPLFTNDDLTFDELDKVYQSVTYVAYTYADAMLEARKEWN